MKKTTLLFIIVIFFLITLSILILKPNKLTNTFDNDKVQKEQYSEEERKLKELNNINKKINYFNLSYIDRYISYKNKNKTLPLEQVILNVNMNLDYKFYENIKPSPSKYSNNVLVNKYYYLDNSYIPKNLTYISKDYSTKTIQVTKDTNIAFEKLVEDAKKNNLTIVAISGYRSYYYQENLYNNYVENDSKEKADTYAARPGHSEHQTGLTIDVSNGELPFTRFDETEEFNWMVNNAHNYGFILRYKKDTENITGYSYESWHYRYVGIDIATEIYNKNITYEEYYTKKIEKY